MTFTKDLSYGAQGDDVKRIQEALNKTGKYNLTVDGIWGKNTDAAIRDYQKNNSLTVDGIFGKNTYASLFGTGTSGATSSETPKFEYDPFEYSSYKESDAVKNAEKAKSDAENALANYGDFSWDQQGKYDNLIKEYENRPDFSYDFNGDDLYQQYKDKYIQQGKMAMADTIGQASAMTGGYGNSYAQTVGNQAYQAQLQNLNDVIPELYAMAYDRYNQKGQDMLNMIGLLGNERDFAYGQWGDGYNRLANDRDYYGTQYNNERTWDYGKYSDDRTLAHGEHTNEQGYAYNNYRDKIADEQWKATFDEGVRQFNEQMNFNKKQQTQQPQKQPTKEPEKEPNVGFTGKTYDAAVSYLADKGINASGIMTASEWQRRKNSYNSSGQGGAEVKNYSSYQAYLKAITEYLSENNT